MLWHINSNVARAFLARVWGVGVGGLGSVMFALFTIDILTTIHVYMQNLTIVPVPKKFRENPRKLYGIIAHAEIVNIVNILNGTRSTNLFNT